MEFKAGSRYLGSNTIKIRLNPEVEEAGHLGTQLSLDNINTQRTMKSVLAVLACALTFSGVLAGPVAHPEKAILQSKSFKVGLCLCMLLTCVTASYGV